MNSREVTFRKGLGKVIHLPGPNVLLPDRRGDEPVYVRDPSGGVLNEGGNRVVVLGSHAQFLRTVGVEELNHVLNVESNEFVAATDPPASYVVPDYEQATHDVNLYKIT